MADPAQTVTPPAPGSPEAEQALVEKFEAAQQPAPADHVEQPAGKSERPENVPEQFWDAEKGEVKVADLLAAVNKPKDETKPKEGEEKPKDETPPASDDDALKQGQEAAQKVGLDYAALEASFFANEGKLTDEDWAKIDAAGIDRGIVQTHIETRAQLAQLQLDAARDAVFLTVGGADQYKAVSEWAAVNVPQAELVAYNSIMNGADVEAAKMAAAGMKARFEAANGSEPNLLSSTGKAQGDVFRSTAEMTAAMRDPRYAKDPAYRKDVEEKLARSGDFF